MEKKLILAVDDNAVNLAAIEHALQEEYTVRPMVAAKRALKFLEGHPVDLVLLDVMMPEMDGVQALTEMRKMENGASVPVFFLTGTQDESVAAQGKELGILDYITKPFDEADLRERIARIFE